MNTKQSIYVWLNVVAINALTLFVAFEIISINQLSIDQSMNHKYPE